MPRFTNASRWLFLCVLVYAPWAYGCTRPWTITLLNGLLAVVLLLWGTDLAVRRRVPNIPLTLALVSIGLLLFGWSVTLNSHSSYDAEFHTFVPLVALWEPGPGSVNRETSLDMMLRVSAIIGALLFVTDLAQRRVWRDRIWWTLVAAGMSIAVLGLLQRITGASMIFWERGRNNATFFATYFYHGNAAAFLNLVLPLSAGFLIAVSRKKEGHMQKAFAASAFVLIVISAFAVVSKAGMIIAGLLLVSLAVWQIPRFLVQRRVTVLVVGVLFFIAALIAGLAHEIIAQRWSEMPQLLNAKNPRLLVAEACIRMLPSAGAFGFGPGTFETVFPHFNPSSGATGIWRYAHNDYLQTAIEWGWLGLTLCAVIFAGGTYLCFRSSRRLKSRERILFFTSALALCGIAVHAAVDFPWQIASLQLYTVVLLGLGWSGVHSTGSAGRAYSAE